MLRSFKSLNEQEVLALAISLEEEDARILGEFAEGSKSSYPAHDQDPPRRCRPRRMGTGTA